MAAREEITVTIDRERIAFGEGPDRTAIIDGFIEEGGSRKKVTLRGHACPGDLQIGIAYRVMGNWTEHVKYGAQFQFRCFTIAQQFGRRGVTRYLQLAPGIGPAVADKLWAAYADKAPEMLREDPKRVSKEIKGLSYANCLGASMHFREELVIEGCTIDLMDLLDGRGFPKKLLPMLISKWGNAAADKIRENPYVLLSLPGAGWLTVDRLYLDLGKDPHAMERQSRCIVHSLAGGSGDTWQDIGKARSAVLQQIGGTDAKPDEAIKLAFGEGWIRLKRAEGTVFLALEERARQEETIANRVIESFSDDVDWPDMLGVDGISDHQQVQAMMAMQGAICCLIGSPGTGKSYLFAHIIKELLKSRGAGEIAACSPTGKASIRMKEAMLQCGVDLETSTIHRLLGVEAMSDGGWKFSHDAENPLPQRFIFVDEWSMGGCPLGAALLSACGPGTHVMFIGDTNQLSPVEHGGPLRDMIAAGVPTGELTEIRRNSGRIVKACKEMRETGRFVPSEKMDIATGENLYVHECSSPAIQAAALESAIRKLRDQKKYDVIWQVQVICAVNNKSEISRVELNKRLQEILNPGGYSVPGNPFRVNDKIICLKNAWTPAADPTNPNCNPKGEVFVANGEMAEVLEVTPSVTTAELKGPYRVVRIPRGAKAKDEEEEEGDTKKAAEPKWSLGFCITSHKSQGSEWSVVIAMIDSSSGAGFVCDRAWVTTTISRAKDSCLCIGKKQTLDHWCQRAAIDHRKTFLKEMIVAGKANLQPQGE